MNLALGSPQVWRNAVPDLSKLSAFREDYVVERYLHEYAEMKAHIRSQAVDAEPEAKFDDMVAFSRRTKQAQL